MSDLNIKYTATRSASFSVWPSNDPWLECGETATIVGYYTAGANPLYEVRRDRDGKVKAIYRHLLVKCGTIEGAPGGVS
jgi:hypothetical protein